MKGRKSGNSRCLLRSSSGRSRRYEAALDGTVPLPTLRERSAVVFDELVRPLLPALHSQQALLFIPGLRPAVRTVCEPVGPSEWALSRRGLPLDGAQWHRLRTRRSGGSLYVGQSTVSSARRRKPQACSAPGSRRTCPRRGGGNRRRQPLRTIAIAHGRGSHQGGIPLMLPTSEIVHFAGHAVPGGEAGDGILLFAPDPRTRTQGPLYPAGDRGYGSGGARASSSWRVAELVPGSDVTPRRCTVVGTAVPHGRRSERRGEPAGRGRRREPPLFGGVPPRPAQRRRFGQAVRQAQLALLRSGDSARAHPSSWAGFVNVGGFKPSEPVEARSKKGQ